MTVLDLHAFAADATAEPIRAHYLAAASMAIIRSSNEPVALVELLDLVDVDWFPTTGQQALYRALIDLAPTAGPTAIITTASLVRVAEGFAGKTGWARTQINALYGLPIETDPTVWRELVLPVWRRHRTRAQIRQLNALVDEQMSMAATEDRWAKALQATCDMQAALSGLYEVQQDQHPFLAVKAAALGPKLEHRTIASGLPALDGYLQGGFTPPENPSGGRLICLAGRPAMGKSAAALVLAANIANAGASALYVSLEMGREQITRRLHSYLDYLECLEHGGNPITSRQLREQSLTHEQRQRYMATDHEALSHRFHFHRGDFCITPEDLVTQIHLARKRDPGLALVVLDYLTLVEMPGRNPVQEVGQLTKLLKRTSLQLGIDILALAQLSRGPESRTNKRPMLSDLRESGRIEEDCDIVLGVYRDSYYNPESDPYELELIILKNREGPVGTCRATCHYEHGAILPAGSAPLHYRPEPNPPLPPQPVAAALGWERAPSDTYEPLPYSD